MRGRCTPRSGTGIWETRTDCTSNSPSARCERTRPPTKSRLRTTRGAMHCVANPIPTVRRRTRISSAARRRCSPPSFSPRAQARAARLRTRYSSSGFRGPDPRCSSRSSPVTPWSKGPWNCQRFTYDLADLGRYYRDYFDLMAHFDRTLPNRIHRVIYETVVADTEAEVRRLLAYCNLPYEEQCLRFYENERAVRTPSSEQVRQPIFHEALEHSRNYEPWLGPLNEALGPVLREYAAAPA